MGSKPKAQTVGFRYSFDIHFGIAKAIDGLLAIRASGKTAWTGNATTNQTFTISAPNLFGGDKGEGGIDGTFDLMMGAEDQPVNTRLAAALGGSLVPNFRGFAGGFFSGLVTSINPYPKKWELLRYRQLAGWDGAVWYPETCAINLSAGQIRAMNPAHILYEVYTNRENGLGLDRSMLDDNAWRAAALTLYNEGFGLCIAWKRSSGKLSDFRDQVCEHIGAYCGPDRNTGLITLKLFRDDYNVDDLPLFDEDSGLLSIEDEEASSALIAPSQLYVEYTDPMTGEIRRARAVNQAIAQRQGGPSAETVSYPWLPTADLAARVAQRDMRIKGSNLRRYKVRLDRRASKIGPGDAFRIRALKRGIEVLVVRAGKIEDGTLAGGVITITALQDVFGMPATSFVAVPPSGYVPPNRTPTAPTLRRLMEVPYRELAGQLDQANLTLVDVTAAWLSTLAARPTGLSLSYSLVTRPGISGAFVDRGVADWCPTAQLVNIMPIAAGPSVVNLTNGIDLDLVTVGQAALLDDEIVRVDAINLVAGTVTLGRGCADTVPARHAAGARIWFYDGFEGVDEIEYSSGVSMQAKLLTNTSEGQLAEGLASSDSLALVGRQGRPYPPGQFRIGGSYWPASISGNVLLTWAHRDRISQADQLIDFAFGSVGPEAGLSYSCRLLRADNNAELAVQDSLTGVTATLISTFVGQTIVELWSVRSGLSSAQRHRWQFYLDGGVPADPDWASVSSLLHLDGPEASTAILDAKSKAWTALGGALLTTSNKRFGTASLSLNGTSARISTSSSSDFDFGSGPFCIETEAYLPTSASLANAPTIISKRPNFTATGRAWIEVWLNTAGRLEVGVASNASTWGLRLTASTSVPRDAFFSWALTRSGNTVRLFLNGSVVASGTFSGAVHFDGSALLIGADPGAAGAGDYFWTGLIDEVRITKGVPRYVAPYTPASIAFADY